VRVVYAIPCRATEAAANGTFVALGIETNMFRRRSFPETIRVPMLAKLAGQPGELAAQHVLTMSVLGPDLTPIVPELTLGFALAAGPNEVEGWEPVVVVPITAEFVADGPGSFSVEVAADGNPPYSVPLRVEQLS